MEWISVNPNPHELFDAFLWTISDDLRVVVPKRRFTESVITGGGHFKLSDLHGRPLCFDSRASLRPASKFLKWHRDACEGENG